MLPARSSPGSCCRVKSPSSHRARTSCREWRRAAPRDGSWLRLPKAPVSALRLARRQPSLSDVAFYISRPNIESSFCFVVLFFFFLKKKDFYFYLLGCFSPGFPVSD